MNECRIFNLLFAAGLLTSASGDQLAQVDLAKLLDPATRRATVEALEGIDKTSDKELPDYRLVDCPQKSGNETLHALLVKMERPSFSFSMDGYEIKDPGSLFSSQEKSDSGSSTAVSKKLERLEECVLTVFAPDGREIRPFGGNNMISSGYVADFNRDGIVDQLDSSNLGIQDGFCVRILTLQTFERQPRVLFNVVYDWHPDKEDDANGWAYECFDADNDGFVEIGFGPKSQEHPREVVFHWDREKSTYRAEDLEKHPHVKVLQNTASPIGLLALKAAGGLRYPLVEGDVPNAAPTLLPQSPFVYQSLKGRSDAEIAAFMGGRATPDSFQPENAPPARLPDGFWEMKAKDAALALVQLNQMPGHRSGFKLVVDDRDQIQPPKSGWFVHDYGSSSCYTFSSEMTAVCFGAEKSFLFQSGTSANGAVGANRLADRTGHEMRLVELSPEEARFLADVLFWLDHVRSKELGRESSSGSHVSSTADGSANFEWHENGLQPVATFGTVWASRSLAARWAGNYDKETFVNFADFLLNRELPEHLGERWNTIAPINHLGFSAPLEERLKPREDSDVRDGLTAVIQTALMRHHKVPWPARVLEALVDCAGGTGLSATLPAIEDLAATLPPASADETEFRKLEFEKSRRPLAELEIPKFPLDGKQPVDPKKEERERAEKRYEFLDKKFEFDTAFRIRPSIEVALRQLRALEKPALLVEMADGKDYAAVWALQQLQLHHLDLYSDLMISRFPDAGDEQSTIFSTLAAASPKGARLLRETLTEAQQADLAVELAEFEAKEEPERAKLRIPALFEILKNPRGNLDWRKRGPAMEVLASMALDPKQRENFESFLLSEIAEPQRGEFRISILSSAITVLANQPDPDRFWDAFVRASTKATEFQEFDALVGALAKLAAARPDVRKPQLVEFLRPQFSQHKGMMNDLFNVALALDLRALDPEIAHLANQGQELPDGENSRGWGGQFEGPGQNRYHRARHVIALWRESDPDTLAKMWVGLFVADAYSFAGSSAVSENLRKRFESSLAAASSETRRDLVTRARAVSTNSPDVSAWISGLP
ncbi:MAG: hypothetical protein ABIT37_12720 [Luteolibacter sp.]